MIFNIVLIWIMGILTGMMLVVSVLLDHQKNQPNIASESVLTCTSTQSATENNVEGGGAIAPDRYGEGIRDD